MILTNMNSGGNNQTQRFVSKSTYLRGLQCLKLVWFQFNQKDAFPAADESAIFEQGHEVGEVAKQLYPSGIQIATGSTLAGLWESARQAVSHRMCVFEADFVYNCNTARADILEPVDVDAWDIIEVKSSTGVKDVYLHDLAFQKFVYTGAGLKIRRCFILHINNEYVRNGCIDPEQLFTKVDVTDRVDALLPVVRPNIEKIRQAIALNQFPEIQIGGHCSSPYPCPLNDMCWATLPEHNVFTLTRGGKKVVKLFTEGINDIKDIPANVSLSDKQEVQRQAVVSGQTYVDTKAIRQFLRRLKYPFYYLDFESFNLAIPPFDGCRPYQQVCFQFSCHIARNAAATPEHESYLAEDVTDRRREFLDRLRAVLGTEGSIVTYNAAFEKTRLRELVEIFPDFADWLNGIEDRVIDLWSPFKSFHYYSPTQCGSASVKVVLPALTGQSYDSLEIADGATASLEFLRSCSATVSPDERRTIRRNLIDYCGLDTQGMVSIVNALSTLVEDVE